MNRKRKGKLTYVEGVLGLFQIRGSLRMKRSSKQRKDRCFARAKYGAVQEMGREHKNEGGPPTLSFLVQPHFSRRQNIENPFLGLSLLPNPTETLATQARYEGDLMSQFFGFRGVFGLSFLDSEGVLCCIEGVLDLTN